jgi:acylphosphatase
MDAAARFVVRGVVQGVFFRASTRAQAERLGLRGHAINLPDGSVEVLAAGDSEALVQLAQWLRRGPAHARVDTVEREDVVDGVAPGGFSIA